MKYMITNINQYILEHLTDQPEDICLFVHPRAPEASLKLKCDAQEPALSYLPPRGPPIIFLHLEKRPSVAPKPRPHTS